MPIFVKWGFHKLRFDIHPHEQNLDTGLLSGDTGKTRGLFSCRERSLGSGNRCLGESCHPPNAHAGGRWSPVSEPSLSFCLGESTWHPSAILEQVCPERNFTHRRGARRVTQLSTHCRLALGRSFVPSLASVSPTMKSYSL